MESEQAVIEMTSRSLLRLLDKFDRREWGWSADYAKAKKALVAAITQVIQERDGSDSHRQGRHRPPR